MRYSLSTLIRNLRWRVRIQLSSIEKKSNTVIDESKKAAKGTCSEKRTGGYLSELLSHLLTKALNSVVKKWLIQLETTAGLGGVFMANPITIST